MKKRIRLTENDLHRVIKESVKKVLKEASYDANGNFDEEQHNLDLISDLNDEMRNVNNNINDALSSLNAIISPSFIELTSTSFTITKSPEYISVSIEPDNTINGFHP